MRGKMSMQRRGDMRKEGKRVTCRHCQAAGPYIHALVDKGDWAWVHWHSESRGWHYAFLCPKCIKEFEQWIKEE